MEPEQQPLRGQSPHRQSIRTQLRSWPAGSEQYPGCRQALAAQLAGELEGHERAHAVAEQCERTVEQVTDRRRDLPRQRFDALDRGLAEPVLTTRQLNGKDVDFGPEQSLPRPVRRCAATGDRQAE